MAARSERERPLLADSCHHRNTNTVALALAFFGYISAHCCCHCAIRWWIGDANQWRFCYANALWICCKNSTQAGRLRPFNLPFRLTS